MNEIEYFIEGLWAMRWHLLLIMLVTPLVYWASVHWASVVIEEENDE